MDSLPDDPGQNGTPPPDGGPAVPPPPAYDPGQPPYDPSQVVPPPPPDAPGPGMPAPGYPPQPPFPPDSAQAPPGVYDPNQQPGYYPGPNQQPGYYDPAWGANPLGLVDERGYPIGYAPPEPKGMSGGVKGVLISCGVVAGVGLIGVFGFVIIILGPCIGLNTY